MLSALEERLDEPTARGLAHAVSRAMRDGAVAVGEKLPPIRTVATELGLSPTTVSAAWALLARSGTIHTDGRRGTTIADPRSGSLARYRRAVDRQTPFSLDLSTGVPDSELLPDLGRALSGLSRLAPLATPASYLDDPVLPELAAVLHAQWPYPVEQITVVDGAMDGLELFVRSALRFGDRVVVESPCFPPLLDLLESIGVTVVGVGLDDQGLRPDELAGALDEPTGHLPVAVFLQPRAQNPTGASLNEARARELAALLARVDCLIVEDDSAGGVAGAVPISLGAWLPERTVHVRSFSKSHGPDLRLAAMSAPPAVLREILSRRQLGQGWSSRMLQQILLSLLTDAESVGEVERARATYARRRESIVTALRERGVEVGGRDGINIWVPVVDETAAVVRLASQGIGVAPGSPFAVLAHQDPHVRVTVGGVADRHDELADALAAAARTGSWSGVR
ncbi:aminotransferase class I/II-fold pyridoxal phosphate-dependent enzyme [Jatrophihabitans telluris]|uniref:Aminotransferase class I/II-fold pyridoxal phosphate-dependent enzyme n=1 Tax=Jatrophihabitans telluris TaxID=2038343 RepID=A0ABY4R616_9ACTN|nr:aminotransferase class I/II-fold pyridoxal phosphate-dependent enzyme [Jatrophihabitans telluris]UQX90342.1 aminotransferase class I/II-fold pyridoxal phosphate-dependent enzyme [Jatrophihabitans telluris]